MDVTPRSMSLYANQPVGGKAGGGGKPAPVSWDNCGWDDEDEGGDGWDNDSASWEDVEGGRGGAGRGGGGGRGAGARREE